jgi:hypothetical protein
MTQTQSQQSIKLYKIETTRAYIMGEEGTWYSMYPHNTTIYYEGHDDGGKTYLLPPGYEISSTKYGTKEIFDDAEIACPLFAQPTGPAILADDGTVLSLTSIE